MQGHLKCWIWLFGESTVSKTKVELWCNWFKEDRENIEAMKEIILSNHRITIREIANDVGISFGLCQAMFMDVLGMILRNNNVTIA